MVIDGFPDIASNPSICGGRPVIAGTRVRVTDILSMLSAGASVEDIVADFPYLDRAKILAAIAYAAHMTDHPVVSAAE